MHLKNSKCKLVPPFQSYVSGSIVCVFNCDICHQQLIAGYEKVTVTSLVRRSYSDLSEFTGFVVAALIDSKLTVSQAIISADRNAIRKIVHSIVT